MTKAQNMPKLHSYHGVVLEDPSVAFVYLVFDNVVIVLIELSDEGAVEFWHVLSFGHLLSHRLHRMVELIFKVL